MAKKIKNPIIIQFEVHLDEAEQVTTIDSNVGYGVECTDCGMVQRKNHIVEEALPPEIETAIKDIIFPVAMAYIKQLEGINQ